MLRIVVALSLMLLIIIKANTPETMLNQCENGKPNEIVSTFYVSELVMTYKGNTYSIVPFDYSGDDYLRPKYPQSSLATVTFEASRMSL